MKSILSILISLIITSCVHVETKDMRQATPEEVKSGLIQMGYKPTKIEKNNPFCDKDDYYVIATKDGDKNTTYVMCLAALVSKERVVINLLK